MLLLHNLVAASTNEHGVTELRTAGSRLADTFYPLFLHTLYAGLVPPFSDFLLAILEVYQIQLLHLHPNSILILAIFAHLCEAYIGIRPSVALFRSFYALRRTAAGERLGCVSFRIAPARSEVYIPIAWDGDEAITQVTKKVDGFRMRWLFVDAKRTNPLLEVPEGPPTKWARWKSAEFEGEKLDAVYMCISRIREAGVTGQMVAKDFTRRRIAPLQWHSEPVWRYNGREDAMRLSRDGFTPEVLRQVMCVLFVTPTIPAPGSDAARPIISFNEESIEEQREVMPVFDEWGLVPAGHRGPRPNPWAAEPEYMDEPAEPEETEESEGASRSGGPSDEDEASRGDGLVGEDEAPRGADPSRGSTSSPRSAPAGVDLQVLSSSDEEEGHFYVARSRRAEEEEQEGPSGGRGGRSEPRSKAAHDRSAATARGAPREETEAPQREAGASNAPPPKAKKRVWVLADE